MAKFRFRLEPVLKLRKLRQEEKERQLAEVVRELTHYKHQKSQIESQIAEYYTQIRQKCSDGPIEISALIADRRFLNQLHITNTLQEKKITETEYKLNFARSELTQAKKQKDIMEKVKERFWEKFTEEEKKKEAKELDDVTNSKVGWLRQQGVQNENSL